MHPSIESKKADNMEEPKKNNSCKDEKKPITIRIRAGGIEGLLLLGGALATAALVSAFTIKRRRRRSSEKSQQVAPPLPELPAVMELNDKIQDEETQGPQFLLPDSDSSPLNHSPSSCVVQIDSTSLVSTQNLFLDEKINLEINATKDIPICCDEVIPLADSPRKPDRSALFNDSRLKVEEFLSPVTEDALLLKYENAKEEEEEEEQEACGQEKLVVMKDDVSADAARVDLGHIGIKDNLPLQVNIEHKQDVFGRRASGNEIAMELQFIEEKTSQHGDQEIICSADSNLSRTPETVNSNETRESLLSAGATEVTKGDDAIETTNGDKIAIDGNLMRNLIQEEHAEEKYDENVEETIAERCESTVEITSVETAERSEEQETLANDDDQDNFCFPRSVAEDYPTENDCVNFPDISLPVLVSSLLSDPEMASAENVKEALLSVEASNKVMEVDEDSETSHADQISEYNSSPIQPLEKLQKEDYGSDDLEEGVRAVKPSQGDIVTDDYNSQIQLREWEESDEEDSNNEDIVEKAEASSEGTGDSSMDSNAEAVWPAESMEELSPVIKELKANNQMRGENLEEKNTLKSEKENEQGIIGTDGRGNTGDDGILKMTFNQRHMMEPVANNNQLTELFKWSEWKWSPLVPVWCLCYCYFGLQFVKISLIIFFVFILWKKFHQV